MFKNTAGQSVELFAFDVTTGLPKTGDAANITAYVSIDGGAVTVLGDTSATEQSSTNAKGVYKFDVAQAETNGDRLVFSAKSSTSNVELVPVTVFTRPAAFTQTNLARLDADVTSRLAPTVAGRTLDITATGAAGVDWANVENPTTVLALSGTTVKTATDVETDTADIQSRLPAALVSGRIDSSVGAMATDVVSAAAVSAAAVTKIQAGLSTLDAAGVRAALGLASANLDTQLSAIAAFIDTEVASILAAVDTEVASTLTAVDTEVAAILAIANKLDTALELDGAVYRYTVNALENAPTGGSAPTVGQIADAVWDEAIAGHLGAGSTGASLNGAGSAGDPWTTALPGAYGAGSAGKIVGDNLNTTVSSRSSHSAADAATAVWAAGARTLTGFGTLVADITAAVWGAASRTLTAFGFTVATSANATETSIDNKIGAFSGSGLNTILGFLRSIARKTAALTPSDMGGTFDNTTDSLEAIRDRGDAAWITGGGGGGFDGANTVTLTFEDANSDPVPNTTFTVVGVGSGTTDATGSIEISLNDGSYTVQIIPSQGVVFSPYALTVSGATSATITGVNVSASAVTARSASYLVSLVRDIIGAKGGDNPYRDGFAADASSSQVSASILAAINTVQREASRIGYKQCFFNLTLTPATSDARNNEYGFDAAIHEIVYVVLTDTNGDVRPLSQMTQPFMDTARPSYRFLEPGEPSSYYFGPNYIGFDFAPDDDYAVSILAVTVPRDLENESDTPDSLPVRFHEMLAYGAAMQLLVHRLSEEGVPDLYRVCESKYNAFYNDLKQLAVNRPLYGVYSLSPRTTRSRR